MSDRPTACRYYPVALLSMRKQDEYVDRDSYAIVKEDHCKGHEVNRRITIADYRKEQGLDEYDELARGWRQLVLKKKSSGPTIGKPSLRSRQLFFMACYDIDRFREFVFADSFTKLFELKPEEREGRSRTTTSRCCNSPSASCARCCSARRALRSMPRRHRSAWPGCRRSA
jgi:hypothetical protein